MQLARVQSLIVSSKGGGFVLPIQAFSLPFFTHVQKQVSCHLRTSSKEHISGCSIAIPEYTLATEAPWPAALRDALAAIQHIISIGIPASDIIIAGDSAGANLLYQVLQHILHPTRLPSVSPLRLDSNFAGALFISPWFDLQGNSPSMEKREAGVDLMSGKVVLRYGSVSLNGLPPSDEMEGRKWLLGELSPIGLDNVVERVLVFGGGQESVIDNIRHFGETIRQEFERADKQDRFELLVEELGIHDDIFLDMVVGVADKAITEVVAWICDTLESSS
jgi:acetyl esterase/lipase